MYFDSSRGTGTVNGGGTYSFIVIAVDGGCKGPDKFRIKITGSNGVVYDNLMNASDNTDPGSTTVIKGGSIEIHKA